MTPLADANPIVGYQHADSGLGRAREGRVHPRLPAWGDVLALVAHPDDESFGLGALLASFVAAGSRVSVLCLPHGEASTLHGVARAHRSVRARQVATGSDQRHQIHACEGPVRDVSTPVPSWVRHNAPAERGFAPWR